MKSYLIFIKYFKINSLSFTYFVLLNKFIIIYQSCIIYVINNL